MYRQICFLLLLILYSQVSEGREKAGILHKMYKRYHNHWYKTFHFIQDTEKYRNDSLVSTQTWYETIIYPDSFRIDLGEPKEGNAVIYCNDSAYIFKNGALSNKRQDHLDLIFMLGGKFFAPTFKDMLQRLRAMHYDVDKIYMAEWQGRDTYVIGSEDSLQYANTFWIDAENYTLVRFINYANGKKLEGQLGRHIPIGGGWTETEVKFYNDGHLMQVEKYRDCVANEPIDPRMFAPAELGNYHWYR